MEARNLGLDIVTFMRDYVDRKSQETGMNFTLLATPAEGLSGRFVRMDKKRYGEIPGVTDRAAYTDSFRLPACCPLSAAERIQREAPYHALTNGGHLTCVELTCGPEQSEAVEAAVRSMKEAGIGCGSVTVKSPGATAGGDGAAGPQPG